MIDITYGVLNYNPNQDAIATKSYTEAVESLYNNRDPVFKSDVYLIDQGSQPDVTEQLARKFNFHSILLRKNVGISRGINLIANLARSKYVSLVTSDIVFHKGTDTRLVTQCELNPDIYQICPVSDNTSLDHQLGWAANENATLVDCLAQELTVQFWPYKVFDSIGYFDERWKACYENMDFALRIFASGGRVVIDPGAFCNHRHSMCVKSGARNHTYDGYIYMPNGFNQEFLTNMWNKKWPHINSYVNLYSRLTNSEILRSKIKELYGDNIYLPYRQEVNY